MCRLLAAPLVLAAALPAQTTHVVGPGGFAEITHALAVASHGDVLLVHPGSYQPFNTGLAVTIRALLPGTVTIVPGWGSTFTVPAGLTAHLVGVDTHFFGVGSGRAAFDQCTFVGDGFGGHTALTVSNGAIHLQGCTVRTVPASLVAPAAVLRAQGSEVTAIDCTIEGADASAFFGIPGPAVELLGSSLRGSSLCVRGGNGGPQAGAVAIWADATSTVWLCDSTLASPAAPCPVQGGSGRLARCTLTPNCSPLAVGGGLGIHRPAPLRQGAPFVLEFRDAGNRLVGVWAALDLQTTPLAGFEQPLLLAPGLAWPVALLTTDATGFASAQWPIPASSGYADRAVWFQAFAGATLPLQASAIAGGIVR